MLQVGPLLALLAPGVLRHPHRGDDQCGPVLHKVMEQQVDGGQGCDCLAGARLTHAPEQSTGWMLDDPIDARSLMLIGREFHLDHLPLMRG